jgi:acetate kinase
MEFTPLSGVMMGSRSGTIDPSVITYAMKRLGKSPDEVIYDLNRRSGLKGISNGDNDMRAIESRALAGDKDAKLALDMFVYNLSKSIASMMVACGGNVDAIVFTAGIGENSAQVRKMTIDCIGGLLGPKVQLDDARNSLNGVGHDGIITKNLYVPAIMVVPTDEEVMICQECERLVKL